MITAVQGCADRPALEASTHDFRLQTTAAKLIASLNTDKKITVRVFSSSELSAYSRSDGRVFISTALLAVLTDEELTAAIAHELGHLINHGDVRLRFALTGSDDSDDEESAADQTASQLMRAVQQDPTELQTMLAKVAADPGLSPQNRQRILERVTRLKSVANAN